MLLFVGPSRQVNPNGEDAARPCLDVDRHCKLNVLFVDCVHARLSDQVPQILDRLEVSINWEAPRTLVVLITAQIMQLLKFDEVQVDWLTSRTFSVLIWPAFGLSEATVTYEF